MQSKQYLVRKIKNIYFLHNILWYNFFTEYNFLEGIFNGR